MVTPELVSPENIIYIYICNITQNEQVVFRNIDIYAYTHICVLKVDKNRGHGFERKQGVEYGRGWRE